MRALLGQAEQVARVPKALAVYEAGVVQHHEVVIDRRLGQVECVIEIADAGLTPLVTGDHRREPEPEPGFARKP